MLGYSTLWYTSANSNVAGLDLVRDHAMQGLLADIEDSFYGIFENFPTRTLAYTMKAMTFPTGNDLRS